MKIREACEADIEAIVSLLADDIIGQHRESTSDNAMNAYRKAFRAMSVQEGNCFLVADVAGQVIGCLQLTFIPGLSRLGMLRAQIESVRVAKAHRGGHVGASLVKEAIRRSHEAKCGLVQLTSDVRRTDAIRFYCQLGFNASHVGLKLSLEQGSN